MHSFQPSRGRIFFEVLCAVGLAASCGGAWMQTGASALLAAAAIATLYSLVRFFDLFRRPSAAVEPQRIAFEPEEVPVRQNVAAQQARIEEQLAAHSGVEDVRLAEATAPAEAQPVELAVSPVGESRRTKAPRKAGGRRSSTSRKAKAAQPAPVEGVELVENSFRNERIGDEIATAAEPIQAEEPFHSPVAPLFEPEPFVRQQQRSMFGRKAG